MAEYIEREAVLNDIGELFTLCRETLPNEAGHHFIVEKELETHLDFVRNLPAADVQPVRHGRWIETTQPMGWDDVTCAECSECGEDFVLDEWSMEDVKNLMHYCPNCGAKMDGGEENGKD